MTSTLYNKSDNVSLLHLLHDFLLKALTVHLLLLLRGLFEYILFFLFDQYVLVVETDLKSMLVEWKG